MVHDADTADLVLVLGTSLSGLNADQMATKCAKRSRKGKSLGTVIVNLQQTPQDGGCTLRCFDKTDVVFQSLLKELGLKAPPANVKSYTSPTRRTLVPYDSKGRLVKRLINTNATSVSDAMDIDSAPSPSPVSSSFERSTSKKTPKPKRKMWLDLTNGAKVRLAKDNNVVGAKQPGYQNISADTVGTVVSKEDRWSAYVIEIGGKRFLLGQWWVEAAAKGHITVLPIVNAFPQYE